MPYLIDGHNLIARLPDLSLDDPNDEAKLVLRLRGFAARTKKQCIVIFDKGLPGGQSPLSTHSVKVIFATAYQTTADRIIYERIRETPDAVNWTVISSDNEVLDSARQHGMKGVTSAEFADRLRLPDKTPPDRSEAAHVIVPEKEVNEWLDIFSAAPPVEPPETPAPPVLRSDNGQNGHHADEQETTATPKKNGARPLSTAGKYDDTYITDNDIASWLRYFNSAPPLPATPKPSHPKKRPIPGKGDYDTPPEPPRPAAARKIDNSRIQGGKYDDDFIAPGEVDEWMRLFGEDSPDE